MPPDAPPTAWRADPRTTYPTRQGDKQHLHGASPPRGNGLDIAVHHGPEGLRRIAQRIRSLTAILAQELRGFGYDVPTRPSSTL
jgi:hypothetical protein